MKSKLLLKKQDILDIERQALRLRSKTSNFTCKTIQCFIQYLSKVYGIDLEIETEEMANERIEREAKEHRRKRSKNIRLGGRASRRDPNHF